MPSPHLRWCRRAGATAIMVIFSLLSGFAMPALASSPPAPPLPVPIPLLGSPKTADSSGPSSAGPHGYWLVASDGGIFAFGGVPFEGSTGGRTLNRPVVAMAATASGRGYWLVASDGGVFAFGDAAFLGSPASLPSSARPGSPVVAIVATPDGNGYWIATVAGGVYAFGDAAFHGSLGALVPGAVRVVGMAAAPDGGGYWLATANGAVYSFGDAGFAGSAALLPLAHPIVGVAATPDGGGYWLVASDGGIFSFGDAAFHGSTGAIKLNQPIVGMAAAPDGGGYWLVASDGGIFSFGDAPFRGSTGAIKLNRPIVGMGVGAATDPYPPGAQGYDISFPQCGGALPPSAAFGIVGVNDGRAFTTNPCFGAEAAWAGPSLSVYMNLNAPPAGASPALSGPAGQCAGNDTGCMAYNYGYNAAVASHATVTSAGADPSVWWLDVETANTWDSNTTNNSLTVRGALDALGALGAVSGIYSTPYQWGVIAGGFTPKTPVWVATGSGFASALADCDPAHGFGGGAVWLTQYGTSGVPYDQDEACPAP